MRFFGRGRKNSDLEFFKSASKEACEDGVSQGNAYAMSRMGILLLNENNSTSFPDGCRQLEKAAKVDILILPLIVKNSIQQDEAGGHYANFLLWSGDIGEHKINKKIAFTSLLKAADAGLGHAQYVLGLQYGDRLSGERDALFYLEEAMKSGNAHAHHGLYCYYSRQDKNDPTWMGKALFHLEEDTKIEVNDFNIQELMVEYGAAKRPCFDLGKFYFWLSIANSLEFEVEELVNRFELPRGVVPNVIVEEAKLWVKLHHVA